MTKVKRKPKLTHFERVNSFFIKYDRIFFIIVLVLSVIVSLLLFDVKVSLLGDDSAYMVRANKLIGNGIYPAFQGPLYPIILAGFILVFGFNVVLMKFLSLVFILVFFILTYLVFKKLIPQFVLILVLFILAINPNLLYYSSQTYSEALFLCLTSIYFFIFYKLINRIEKNNTVRIADWIVVGFVLFLLSLAKNLGISFVIVSIIFFLSYKQLRNAIYSLVSFLVFALPYQIVMFFTLNNDSQLGGQLKGVLYKNPYNYSEGFDSFTDILVRFAENSKVFLSIHFFQSIGIETSPGYLPVIIISLIIIGTLLITYRNNKFLFLVGLFLIVTMLNTFVIQTLWNIQLRFIIPFFPYLLVYIAFGLVEICARFFKGKGRLLISIALLLSFISVGNASIKRMSENLPVIKSNLAGNLYYGHPENWVNYLKMCNWTSDSLHKDAVVACRKPNLATIYSNGKNFEGIYRLTSKNPDTLLKMLSEKEVQYLIRGNLKGQIYNTIPELLNIIYNKYPNKLVVIKQFGEKDPAYLVELKN